MEKISIKDYEGYPKITSHEVPGNSHCMGNYVKFNVKYPLKGITEEHVVYVNKNGKLVHSKNNLGYESDMLIPEKDVRWKEEL